MAVPNLTTNFLTIEPETKNDHFKLMLQPIGLVTFYILLIFSLGPKFMKNRNGFSLRKTMVIYNLIQIISNAFVFIMIAKLLPNFSPSCSLPNISSSVVDTTVQKIHYYYTLLKYLDLLDTIFFVLRKKSNQVTLLHVHHHVGMALTSWITLKYLPGGVIVYVFFWNTFVHVAMYSYYLLTSLGTARGHWWKKHLTQLQLVQHFALFTIFALHLFNFSCQYSKAWLVYYLVNISLTIYLFLKFYIRQYVKQRVVKSQ